jgi:aminopeptidase N
MRYYISVLAILFVFSCKPSKTVTHAVPPEKAADNKSLPVYQASRTKVFDLIHTSLQIRFDWSKRYLYGKAAITLTPHFYPSQELVLDARGMIINSVELQTATGSLKPVYIYKNDSLVIQLDRIYRKDESVIVRIDYISRPEELEAGGSEAITSNKGLYFINPDGKDPYKPQQIWTQGETQAASAWFPTIDAPDQKMTQDIAVTVDTSMVTLSNGLMISSVKNNDGTKTETWKQALPHAPYLAMVVVGKFAIIRNEWQHKEVSYYVEPAYEKPSRKVFAETPAMIEFFSNRLGVPYPWDKYAQIVVRDYVSGSMENTSSTLHGDFMYMDERKMLDFNGEEYISHELFHQWFGDLVTCESWSNLPLNESFASYGEYLWTEFRHGREAADYAHQNDMAAYFREAKFKRVNLVRFDYEQQEDMFDRHSYEKGACILHMLRKYVGDDAFFASLKWYLTAHRFKTAEVHDLRLAFEEVTGEDLNWFFNQWFYDKGHPSLDISYGWNEQSSEISIQVRQMQDLKNNPLYKLPLTVDIYNGDSIERKKLTLTRQNEAYIYKAAAKPDLINFDAEKMLLAEKNDHHTEKEWKFMYEHGRLYSDRAEALAALSENYSVPSYGADVVKKALDDPFAVIRAAAAGKVEKLTHASDSTFIKNKLIDMVQHDPASSARGAALIALLHNYKESDFSDLLEHAVADSSYIVSGAALVALTGLKTERGLQLARGMQDADNNDLNDILHQIYSRYGDERDADYMHETILRKTGFDKYNAVEVYARFLQRISNETLLKRGIDYIYKVASDDDTWWIRLAAIQELSEIKSSLKNKNLPSLITYIDECRATLKSKEKDARVIKLLE